MSTPTPIDDRSEQRLQFKQAALLWAAGVVGGVAVLPYTFAMQAEQLRPYLQKTGSSLWNLAVLGTVQTSVLMTIAVFAGLWAARRISWQAPVSAAWVRGEPVRPVLRR